MSIQTGVNFVNLQSIYAIKDLVREIKDRSQIKASRSQVHTGPWPLCSLREVHRARADSKKTVPYMTSFPCSLV